MRAQGGGLVVNVSSMVTRNHFPRLAGYASTKYAVNALTLAARQELAEDNIRVCLIRPKLVETDFGRNSLVAEPDAIRDRSNPHAPPMDTAEFVAEKIAELIVSEAAELDLA
jgi:NAD(P)-dependent dehydrogenase (short-subunit alcohol dehydrogenase family)